MRGSIVPYIGGKARMASKILGLLPPDKSYSIFADVFGGAANVILRVPERPGLLRIYNDADDELVNFFQVMEDPRLRRRFRKALPWIPFSRRVFQRMCQTSPPTDPVRRALRFFIICVQGFGGGGRKKTTPGNWGYDLKEPNFNDG